MSWEATAWAMNRAPVTDPGQKLVLLALAELASDDGRGAWPSRQTLAAKALCSVRHVTRQLQALEAAGLIRRGDQRHVQHIRADRRPVVYDLNMRHGVTDCHPVRGDTDDTAQGPRGDISDSHGVTPMSPKPPVEPPRGGARAHVTRAREDTPRRCRKHQHDTDPPACGACRDARQAAEAAEAAELDNRRRAEHMEALHALDAYRQAVRDCGMCDVRGYLPSGAICRHDPAAGQRAKRGAAAARAALRGATA